MMAFLTKALKNLRDSLNPPTDLDPQARCEPICLADIRTQRLGLERLRPTGRPPLPLEPGEARNRALGSLQDAMRRRGIGPTQNGT